MSENTTNNTNKRIIETSPAEDVSSPTSPALISSIGEYNIITFEERFYAVPQKLGPVDFFKVDVGSRDGVLIEASLEDLRAAIGSKEWRNVAITLVLTAIVLIFTTSLMMY